MRDISNFDKITINLASPERIREWSYGEVKKPETINYRTLRPERDGLFCERIFGTTKEWECYCGKFKSIRYKGVVCDRCGVEVAHFKVRRERMGHIELASPVSHIWFYKSVPSRIGLLLGISRGGVNELRSILYYEKYVILDAGETELKYKQLLSEEEYLDFQDKFGNAFTAEIGASAVKKLLESIALEDEARVTRAKMSEKGHRSDPRLLKRLEILEDFKSSNNRPDWMILEVIPVIPPELRPMVQLDGGRFATSDLNDLYRRVINRNNRLTRLLNLKAPEIIIRNEKRMLQEAVDALFDNSRKKRVVKGPGNRPLKSLSDMLKGKQGRFRQNLLGKRVDYSGRSVIVVGPDLKIHQCGLPKKMALELFKPFVMKELVERGLVYNIKSAKKLVEKEKPDVWGVLEDVIKEHPVLLNRAPTLHRLGIQAFEPTLVEGKAIKLHPMVCKAFNADFDGDQMAVHVPLSAEAQIECWLLMLSAKNLLDPANGRPIVIPTQDMVLGLNYLTKAKRGGKGENKYFSSVGEMLHAIDAGALAYQSMINILKTAIGEHKFPPMMEKDSKFIPTTPGRILFNEILPKNMAFINDPLNDKRLVEIVENCIKFYSSSTTTEVLDKMKELGFKYATVFGATIGIDDIKIPSIKHDEIRKADDKVNILEERGRKGYITPKEKKERIIDIWQHVSDRVSEKMMEELKLDKNGFNPLYIMAESGARGSKQQIKQLAGMRGLMVKPNGEILELPIKSNFKEGLTVLEYFLSTHGARKGLSDTALKTADAGYLTRRLVDIAQDVIITEEDCGTINGIEIKAVKRGDEVLEALSNRIVGRTILQDVYHPKTDELIISANSEVDEETALLLEEIGVEKVRMRAVFTCEARHGICQKCYGRNLATNKTVEIGEAVGTIAAQSIGQPGTQLTMRTFHIGGAAARQTEEENLKFNYPVLVNRLPEDLIKMDETITIMPRSGKLSIQKVFEEYPLAQIKNIQVKIGDSLLIGDIIGYEESGKEIKTTNMCTVVQRNNTMYLIGNENLVNLRAGSKINVKEDSIVPRNQIIAEFDPYNEPILSEVAGKIQFRDLERGITLKIEIDKKTGNEIRTVSELKDATLSPKIAILTKDGNELTYSIPGGAVIVVNNGDEIQPGTILAQIVREQAKVKDITGGLPRVAELFEARKPKDACVVSEQDGRVRMGDRVKGRQVVYIDYEYLEENGEKKVEEIKHLIPVGKRLLVREGEYVIAGSQLCDGPINPHDILKIEGDQRLQEYLINEIQEVYRLQGVKINDKHVGVIIRQMLKKVEITDVGDTDFIIGQQVDKLHFQDENNRVTEEGGKPASARPILLGLTKASINIDSFLSAASFQETTKVLTNAAIKGKEDNLRGLKENVIIGHLIPAGTGIKNYEIVDVIKVHNSTPEFTKENAYARYDED